MQSPQWPATVTPFEGLEHLLSPGSMWHSAKDMLHDLGSALRAKEGPVELFRQWSQPKEPTGWRNPDTAESRQELRATMSLSMPSHSKVTIMGSSWALYKRPACPLLPSSLQSSS